MPTDSDEIFEDIQRQTHRSTDRMFFGLLLVQWGFTLVVALVRTPHTWTGTGLETHMHVKAALGFGGIINAPALALIVLRPGWWGTRHTVAAVQVMWSALLIMVWGGRIETHFHIFGSLAFLAFYRDWRVLLTATTLVAADHLARGLFWPDSVYGTANPEWWRFLEHIAWVLFEDTVLILGCAHATRDMRRVATRDAELAATNAAIEVTVETRTSQLKDAMERYRALVETTAAIPFEYDLTGNRMLYIAPQAAQLLGCNIDELTGRGLFSEQFHPGDLARTQAAFQGYVQGGCADSLTLDFRMLRRSGGTVYVRSFISSGNGQLFRGVMLDMTKQRQLELELAQAQKLESVGRLAAGVAHEINTPVQFVSDSVRFVREGVSDLSDVVELHRESTQRVLAGQSATDAAQRAATAEAEIDLAYLFAEFPSALDRALEGLGRVSDIIKSMKVFAHPDVKEMTEVDLNAAVETALTITRNEYKYVADVATELGALPLVKCHAGEINQVLLNILINAAHAISDRNAITGERGTITVATHRTADHAVISISDTGGGIPDDIRDQIFEPFFTTKEVGRGTGQGLAIARSLIVDKHRGTLTFDTEPDRGTTFHIGLPLHHDRTQLAA